MTLREQLTEHIDVFGVFSPVAPDALARVADGFGRALAGPEGRTGRRRNLGLGKWGQLRERELRDLPALVRRATVEYPAGLTIPELAEETAARGYDVLPLALSISGELLAVMVPHAFFDGQSIWKLVESAFAYAVDAPLERTTAEPTPFPVYRALKHAKLDRPSVLVDRFRESKAAAAATDSAPLPGGPITISRERRRTGYASVFLDADRIAAVEKQPIEGRATRGMRLIALGLDAFADAAPEGLDMRIRTMIDARRYLPKDAYVDGSFSVGYPLGMLRSTDNSPGALTSRLAGILTSKAPLATLAGDLASVAKRQATRLVSGEETPFELGSLEVGVSILPARMPEGFWLRDGGRVSATMHYHATMPSNPFLQVAEVGTGVSIGLWDETGAIDRARFVQAVLDRVSGTVPTMLERA
ncbi:hypothetical protein ET445_01545 [Agromyces protaetiae]|uniref:Condensation domain-containing protein n=1 Tax=Agromyces protaetiae TaxID=2509455 RepID=A0A4P6FES3_9MICO|nr:hypothetical protein [Agromyces protaetiae]QAY72217.1 hypothetical protein ET445_01545 [Agromyces protaetiae]